MRGTKGCLAAMAAIAVMAAWPSGASAGRIVITGHDADDHCSGSDPEQCHYFSVATRFVRRGAPEPSKRVLLFDCNGGVRNALDNAFGTGDVPRKQVCPSDSPSAFRDLALSTDRFSAILVGSSCDDSDSDGVGDNTLNLTDDLADGCDDEGGSLPDTDLINERKDAIRRFFNRGGGLFVMSGDSNGDGDPSTGPDRYYNFLPLPANGVAVNPPFCLTEVGKDLGLEDQSCPNPDRHNGTRDDINCCETHNSFAEPAAGSALKVAERDSEGFAETLVAEGEIRGGDIVEGGKLKLKVNPKQAVQNVSTCFGFTVKSGGEPIKKATVKFGGERAKTNKKGKVTICQKFGELGKKRAKATKRGFDPDTANIFVVRDPGFTGRT